ncbi:hypothetical protein X925_05900 [Petrotoga sp. 9T1HF07.CasAA.8.2]|uniref:hypothetical protein n=1 Tax=Petrotoga sp. 9T1HF07.CasAA.8.2 TaxID=1434329 RepID=UPI000CA92357|nr:hypothetical protein [Petrotoga sp. 9T1HF07.CasAA.8.2]PNR88527.1 hypothetical protein X925_05900 [Petrotoga sp. 9T1HF07.CasAA.8.2]
MISEEIIAKLPKEEQEKFKKHRNAFLELLRKRTDYKEIEERYEELKEMEVPKMFNTLEEIAKRDREKAKVEGKLEERREFEIRILSKRFGNQLTEEIKDKIRKADEKTIDYIGDNLLEITIEDLKELLK